MTVWINGVPCERISAYERSLSYGDGTFTTIRIEQRKALLWALHLARLQEAVQRLNLPVPDWSALTAQITTLADQVKERAVLKIVLTRGQGGRGYSPQGCHSPLVMVFLSDFPTHYDQWQQEGIAIGDAKGRLSISPMLAGIKHNNRLEQVLLKQEIERKNWQEAIVLDALGWIAEGVTANLFWHKDNVLFTSRLEDCGVKGIARRRVLQIAEELGMACHCVKAPLSTLDNVDGVFFTNALMGVVPVRGYTGRQFDDFSLANAIHSRIFAC